METIVSDLMQAIAENGAFAGPFAALLCFAASLTGVGLVVPATAGLIFLGGLVGAGVVDAAPVLVGSVLGSAGGGALSYHLGRRFGARLLRRWPLRGRRRLVARARLAFRRGGAGAIFASRFLGPLRPTLPFVAGAAAMTGGGFHRANLLSALVWPPATLLPGWLAAAGWNLSGGTW